MFQPKAAFSGFSVDDQAKAKEFYTKALGLKLEDETMGLQLALPGGGSVFVYAKEDHQPATYTMLNFVVDDIDAAVDELVKSGVEIEHYEYAHQDAKGIASGKPSNQCPDIDSL